MVSRPIQKRNEQNDPAKVENQPPRARAVEVPRPRGARVVPESYRLSVAHSCRYVQLILWPKLQTTSGRTPLTEMHNVHWLGHPPKEYPCMPPSKASSEGWSRGVGLGVVLVVTVLR